MAAQEVHGGERLAGTGGQHQNAARVIVMVGSGLVPTVQTLQCLHLVGRRLARLRHPTRLLEIVLSVKR